MSGWDLFGIVLLFTAIFSCFEYYEHRENSRMMKAVTFLCFLMVFTFSEHLFSPWYVLTHDEWFVYASVLHLVANFGIRLYLGPILTVQKVRQNTQERVRQKALERRRFQSTLHASQVPRKILPVSRVSGEFPDLGKAEQERLVSTIMNKMNRTSSHSGDSNER